MFVEHTNTKEMLHAIVDTIDEGIHVIDINGITIYYNQIAAKHDGVHPHEVVGKPLLDVFPSLTRSTSTLLKVVKTGKPIYHQQQTYTNIRGELIDTVNTTIPIYVKDQLVGALEVAKDLTKIKQLSEKLLDIQSAVATNQTTAVDQEQQPFNGATYHMQDIITSNKTLLNMKTTALKAAKTSSPVLVYGETGTGKELLVQAIHNASPRRKQHFIAQNCAAIPPSLLEGILFGTTKGSFTGAVDRPGLFELAHNGTLFLDEIHSMPQDIQAKLLRVLQDGVVRRVGSTKGHRFDVRIITAINRPPLDCVKNEQIREDLYYRINVVSFHLPPLRERYEDLTLLTDHFIKTYNFRFHKLVTSIDREVMDVFHSYQWPGNVRELQHTIEAAMNLVEGDTIKKEHLPLHLQEITTPSTRSLQSFPSLRTALADVEEELITKALTKTNGNIKQAAKLLDIPRQTLQYKLSKRNR
ncbi:sigma-54 interaction domain-containing protein [Desertibacillus haloalkaliphilus]|uniref:sigma-54 interaction domain-containing protein n=1 Tax=Desertibacillus haloalkaliphilus TaxID=1328930 RepID=UPI001C26F066|nr:sigma 54-interacting transcriptional regulator [Desertibacillus haloalkaliphilus]MBU8908017.1 sigma 54-interacting transcriptional regulator [Desertibacillus haloalkaliphilus]